MCEFLSFFAHQDDGARVSCGDCRSHSASAELLAIDYSSPTCRWREAEWTRDDEAALTIRTLDMERPAPCLRAELLAKYPTRAALLAAIKLPPTLTELNLRGVTIPAGFVVPDSVRELNLSDATVPAGFVVPYSVRELYLSDAKIPAGFVVPDRVNTLYLSYVTIPAGFVVPDSVRELDLSDATVPAGFVVPDSVNTLYLRYATVPAGFVVPYSVRVIGTPHRRSATVEETGDE